MIYDATESKPVGWAWKIGAILFSLIGRFDKVYGAKSWMDALEWVNNISKGKTIDELHFWGHGSWGSVYIDGHALGVWALERASHPVHMKLLTFAERLNTCSLIWFRTCATFGNTAGHDFASRWADFLQCRIAASTYNIGFWHAGTHSVKPGQAPYWSILEGVKQNDDGESKPTAIPFFQGFKDSRTLLFLRSHLPAGW
jgi:hypothetical protein